MLSNLRVTSLLAGENLVYVGTGGGEVFKFTVVASVVDPEASIKEIAAERGNPRIRKRKTDEGITATAGEGLLSKALLGREKEAGTTTDSSPSYFASRHRKTQFGRTLRHGRPEGDSTGLDLVAIYKLEYTTHQQLGSAANEPVRVVLPIG